MYRPQPQWATGDPGDETSDEFAQVDAWRLKNLLELGFPLRMASELSVLPIDLHEAARLIGEGCPPRLARRILLPLP